MSTERAKRKLSAILSADAKGYSRLIGEDEVATIRTLKEYRELISKLIKEYRGRVVDSPGDNVLAEFASVVDAVESAVEIQNQLKTKNAQLPEKRRMEFRIGINIGDVIEEGERIYGDGVNVAARIEGLALPGGVCVSGTAYDHVENKVAAEFEFLGEQTVKNIRKSVRVYRIRMERGVPDVAIRQEVTLPDKPSIAVLPFVNMSDDPKQEFFSDGITEEIINALSKLPHIFVIARNSSFTYKGKPVKVQQVAQDLGVNYVLEGSVRREENRVRITAQLVDALTGRHVFSERYDRELKEIFATQDEIAIKVLTTLRVALTDGEIACLQGRGVSNVDAFFKLLEAHTLIQAMNIESNAIARRLVEEALLIEPGSSRAHFLLATTHFAEFWLGSPQSPGESIAQGIAIAQRAIEMDPYNAAAHSLLGMLYVNKGEYDKGVEEGERGATMDPNSVTAVYFYGSTLMHSSRYEEAIPVLEKAIRLSPLKQPPQCLVNLAASYGLLGKYDEAVWNLKRALQEQPNQYLANIILTEIYAEMGRFEDALAQGAQVLRLNPKFSLEGIAETWRFKNPADMERYLHALRKAGLPEKSPPALPGKPSIAVLPFVNMSGDPDQEYFSDGITEDIITALSKFRWFFVTARNSTFTYKGKSVDVKDVARSLGVRYVLEGSVRKAGNRLRITAQLIDAPSGHHVWAERYDRDLNDIFAVQDEITERIVTSVGPEFLSAEMQRAQRKELRSLDAWDYVMRAAFHHSRYIKEDVVEAQRLLRKSIELDPLNAGGFSLLAFTHLTQVQFGWTESAEESIQEATKAAQSAVAIDDRDALAHTALGLVDLISRRYDDAIRRLEGAIDLNVNLAYAYGGLGQALALSGEYEKAVVQINKAVRLSPNDPFIVYWFGHLGLAAFADARYEEACEWGRKVVRVNPQFPGGHRLLAASYGQLGRINEAATELKELLRLMPGMIAEDVRKQVPFKQVNDMERYIEGLLKAGLK